MLGRAPSMDGASPAVNRNRSSIPSHPGNDAMFGGPSFAARKVVVAPMHVRPIESHIMSLSLWALSAFGSTTLKARFDCSSSVHSCMSCSVVVSDCSNGLNPAKTERPRDRAPRIVYHCRSLTQLSPVGNSFAASVATPMRSLLLDDRNTVCQRRPVSSCLRCAKETNARL